MNTLTFTIEKILNPDKTLHGFFVSNHIGSIYPMKQIFSTMAAMMGENEDEQWKDKKNQSDKIFCSTEKQVKDYISFKLSEF